MLGAFDYVLFLQDQVSRGSVLCKLSAVCEAELWVVTYLFPGGLQGQSILFSTRN